MSSVGNISAMSSAIGAGRMAVQIAVPPIDASPAAPANLDLEAAVQRVSTLLYMRSHCEVPPDVIDMGGGVFNVVV
jgi:hypothetical protein